MDNSNSFFAEGYLEANGPKAKIDAFKAFPKWRQIWWIFATGAALYFSSLSNLTGLALIVAAVSLYAPMKVTHILAWCLIGIPGLVMIVSFSDDGQLDLNRADEIASGIIMSVGSLGIGWLMLRWFLSPGRTPEAFKDKPNHLGAEAAARAAEKLDHTQGVWAGRAGEHDLVASIEDRAVVLGPPGAGKTAFMVAQILKWADTKRPFICLDTKPEIFGITRKALAEKGYRTLVYNPTAAKGQRYNPIDDLDGPEAVGELAAALIPSDDPADAVFNESARDLLDALISHLIAKGGKASLPGIRNLIQTANDYQSLLRTLGNSPDPDVVDIVRSLAMTAANERLLGSIFATLRSNLRFLRYPNIRASLEVSDFRLADITSDQPIALFLQFEEHQRETTARLLAAMIAHIMRHLISHTQRPPVLLLLDEIGTVPPIPGMIDKLNTIRSRNLPTWTYWQSLEQMQRYGVKPDEGANLILGACDMQMVFRLNDNASAQWMSQRIGVVDVTVLSESIDNELISRVTSSAGIITEPKVFPHELQQLDDNQVACTYRGRAWKGEATPYFEIWPDYRDKRPKGDQLFGEPFPEQEDDAA